MLIHLAVLLVTAQMWTDPSAHKSLFVTLEPDVKLEVLDWGGSGPPLVLLAGYLSAHAYDELAPRLTATHHVYGISRRGYGASSRPEAGYTAARSADDIIRVLEMLDLRGVILAGHSWGGQDLSTLGARHAERVAALVYINSAEDPTLTMADYDVPRDLPPPPPPRPRPLADRSSFAAYRESEFKANGALFPEAELRQTFEANPDGSVGEVRTPKRVRDAIFAGRAKPDYSKIKIPVLALFSYPDGADAVYRILGKRHRDDLIKGVPQARVVDVQGGNFYLFLSHPDMVAREIRTFTASLP